MAEINEQNYNSPLEEPAVENKIFFEWYDLEYPIHDRNNIWYIVMIGIALALVIYSVIIKNPLFAIIIILITFIVYFKSYIPPRKIKVQITEDGILFGNEFIDYERIKKFWIIYNPPATKKIYFAVKGLRPIISVFLDNLNPVAVREILLEYIDEDLEQETQTLEDQLETILKL